jgi:hypothetical protein
MEKAQKGENRSLAGTRVFNKVFTRMKEWMEEFF